MQAPASSPMRMGLRSSPRMKTLRYRSMMSTPKRSARHTLSHAFSRAGLSKWTRITAVVSSCPSSSPAQTASRLMMKGSLSGFWGLPARTRTSISSALLMGAFFCCGFQPKWLLRCWFMPTFHKAFQVLCSLFANSIVKTLSPFASFSRVHHDSSLRTSVCRSPLSAARQPSSPVRPALTARTLSSQQDISTHRSCATASAASPPSTYRS
mmetsp:Transcript_13053/g.35617  ORF Transcript_13053/g.35617 Transcript_13053/m.35617 type:complete len:210 (-) Transcript_13053:241-870(-)